MSIATRIPSQPASTITNAPQDTMRMHRPYHTAAPRMANPVRQSVEILGILWTARPVALAVHPAHRARGVANNQASAHEWNKRKSGSVCKRKINGASYALDRIRLAP
jgi:hypothetical protein